MTRIVLRNRSPFTSTTNEVKIGENIVNSCDSSLQHLGQFALEPGEERQIAVVDNTTDVYWKNIYEPSWTHAETIRFDELLVIDASMSESSSTPVDICDTVHRLDLFHVKPFLSRAAMMSELASSLHNRSEAESVFRPEGVAQASYVEVIGQLRPDMPMYTMALDAHAGTDFVQFHEDDLEGTPVKYDTVQLGGGRQVTRHMLRVKRGAVGMGIVLSPVEGLMGSPNSSIGRGPSNDSPIITPLRDAVQPVVTFTQVGQKWSFVHTFVRKIYYSKDVDSQRFGAVRLQVRSYNANGAVLLEEPISYPRNNEFRQNWGTVYVEFLCQSLGPNNEPNEIYIHVEWD